MRVLHLLGAAGLLCFALRSAEPSDPTEGPRPHAIATLEAGLTKEQKAELRFLEHVGWRLSEDPSVTKVTLREGTPCARDTVAAAQEAGDLRILVPPAPPPDEVAAFAATLASLSDSKTTRCAYVHRVHAATQEATRRLGQVTDRGIWRFPSLLFWNSPYFLFRPPQPEWTSEGPLRVACTSSAQAIRAIYERGGVAECYSAQQVAIFAVQYELYGPEWFDRIFVPRDIAVGKPVEIRATAIGRFTKPDTAYPWTALLIDKASQDKDPGLVLSGFGPKAFSGLAGIVQSQDPEDQSANQNFLIVSISAKAVAAIAEHGGFSLIAERSKKAYASLDAAGGLFTSAAVTKARRAEVDAILAEPVFSEFRVYVHPFGVVSLGRLVLKDMEDHDTPVYLNLYTDGREDALYQRYRGAWKDRWLAESAAPVIPGSK